VEQTSQPPVPDDPARDERMLYWLAGAVIVGKKFLERADDVTPTEDQRAVEQLASHGANQ